MYGNCYTITGKPLEPSLMRLDELELRISFQNKNAVLGPLLLRRIWVSDTLNPAHKRNGFSRESRRQYSNGFLFCFLGSCSLEAEGASLGAEDCTDQPSMYLKTVFACISKEVIKPIFWTVPTTTTTTPTTTTTTTSKPKSPPGDVDPGVQSFDREYIIAQSLDTGKNIFPKVQVASIQRDVRKITMILFRCLLLFSWCGLVNNNHLNWTISLAVEEFWPFRW